MAYSIAGFKRRTAEKYIKFNRYIILLEQVDRSVNIFGGDPLLDIFEDTLIKRLNAEIHISATALSEHLGYRFGDGIHACLTPPYNAVRAQNIAYTLGALFIPDEIIIHKPDGLYPLRGKHVNLLLHALKRTEADGRFTAGMILTKLNLARECKRRGYTIDASVRAITRCKHRSVWTSLKFGIMINLTLKKIAGRKGEGIKILIERA